MQFVDRSLARRFESAEEMPQVYHALADREMRPHIGSAVEAIAGGHMIFAGLGSPIGRGVGMGFEAAVTEADFDRLESFYFSRKAPAQLDYCPLNDISLLEIARKRGYSIAELNNVLARKLDGSRVGALSDVSNRSAVCETDQPAEPFPIRTARPDEALAFSAVLRESFFPDGGEPAGFDEMIAPMFSFPGAINFVAEADGKIIGTGAGLVIPEHRIIGLYGAGTLKPYRGRGLQAAMLRRRMAVAAQAGCEYAVIVTHGGTTSMRNAERAGFTLAYSKASLIKDLPKHDLPIEDLPKKDQKPPA